MWVNSIIYHWYIGSGTSIVFVHWVQCTEMIGVNGIISAKENSMVFCAGCRGDSCNGGKAHALLNKIRAR